MLRASARSIYENKFFIRMKIECLTQPRRCHYHFYRYPDDLTKRFELLYSGNPICVCRDQGNLSSINNTKSGRKFTNRRSFSNSSCSDQGDNPWFINPWLNKPYLSANLANIGFNPGVNLGIIGPIFWPQSLLHVAYQALN